LYPSAVTAKAHPRVVFPYPQPFQSGTEVNQTNFGGQGNDEVNSADTAFAGSVEPQLGSYDY